MKTQITYTQQHAFIDRIQKEPSTGGTAIIEDHRPGTVVQRKLQETMHAHSGDRGFSIQRKNNTGLPDHLKSGIENLSGYNMDDVKVYYNSSKPAQLQAHAYAQGTDIHLASGQEKHLPHEAWHVVQQKQGRVKPTIQMKDKVNINDDAGLEKEADVMGTRARNMTDKRPLITSVLGQKSKTVPESGQRIVMRKSNDVIQTYGIKPFGSRSFGKLKRMGKKLFNKDDVIEINYNGIDRNCIEASKKYIDKRRFIWRHIQENPLKTAMNKGVLDILRRAMIEYSKVELSFISTYDHEEEYSMRNFGLHGKCEVTSVIWSYIINKIEGQYVASPVEKWDGGGDNYHFAVKIEGYGEVDATYRQFYNMEFPDEEEALKDLTMAVSGNGDKLPDNEEGYIDMTKNMII